MQNQINIRRKRYIILRQEKEQLEIFCGLARNYSFRPISDIGDVPVKTYLSEKKALAAFNASWGEEFDPERYLIIPVMESFVPAET
jgi:hypothetical protein